MAIVTTQDSGTQIWVVDVSEDHDSTRLDHELDQELASIAQAGGGNAQLWIHDVNDAADSAAVAAGFTAYRDLWQLRCPLPAEPANIETRAFRAGDADAMIGVNNRAFSWHPEQGGLTRDRLEATMSEPWYNPDGFRIHERDGEIIGFCWTKVHADDDPVLGEIFVIAVDPSAHGQGLGSPMTRAGLDWLAAQGIEHGMLYVESDNHPANKVYERIGFVHHRTDRAYDRTIEASNP
ncbi:MAG: mycothiol synthase [Actinomycetota bacterium]